jgi:tetratricopeptide (TPR) repeat protein
MQRILIAAAALAGALAIAAGLRRYAQHRSKRRDEEHIANLQATLGIKPGVKSSDKASPDVSQSGTKVPAQSDKPVTKSPGTALIVHPDADGLRVNGPWLQTVNFTIEPAPIHGTRQAVNAALDRAKRHNNACNEARKKRRYDEAEGHIEKALAEVHSGLRRDHWYSADVLNQLGCLTYERGNLSEAREIWWQAEQICQEWPKACAYLLPTVQDNIARARKELGF